MTCTVVTRNDLVDREPRVLPPGMRARFARICGLIKAVGLERMGAPHVRHLTGQLWEMRLRGRDGITRAPHVTRWGQRVVGVRVFARKTRRTRREIEPALKRTGEARQ